MLFLVKLLAVEFGNSVYYEYMGRSDLQYSRLKAAKWARNLVFALQNASAIIRLYLSHSPFRFT